jgi:hypothetical protein
MRGFARALSVLALALAVVALVRARGETVPLYAARTGNQCQTCHFDPNGGGPRNEFGFAFAKARHSLEPETDSTSAWGSLDLTNRIGEKMPVYIGVNQRFMMLANNAPSTTTPNPSGIDRLGFMNMENGIHLAFQPHPRITLSYTLDVLGFSSSNLERTKDAYGMFTGLPMNGYIRAGRFRTPFGLRMDDHTVATRNSFLDFSTQESFLPYDSRSPDEGVEVGADHGPFFGRAAFTNGPLDQADVLGGTSVYAETKTIKLGMNDSHYQGAVSFYDAFNQESSASQFKRATRWGYYAMSHTGPLAFIGEIAAGTDEQFGGLPKRNSLAYYAELDYAPKRWVNVRGRYDRLELGRSSDANKHQRYSLEAEVVPVPFAELRFALRQIDHLDETAFGFKDETQGFVQFHFSY